MKIQKANGGSLIWEETRKSLRIDIEHNEITAINKACINFYSLKKEDVIGESIDSFFPNWQDLLRAWENYNLVVQKHPEIFKEANKVEDKECVFIHPIGHGNKTNLGLISLKKKNNNFELGINFPFIFDPRNIVEKIEAYENIHHVIGASHGIFQPAMIINHLFSEENKFEMSDEKRAKGTYMHSKNIMFEINNILRASYDLRMCNEFKD